MAVQSSLYYTDGVTRNFPSTKHIPTILHTIVLLKKIVDSSWVVVNPNTYTLVGNSIIFNIAPDIKIYSEIEFQVADNASELLTSPTSITLVGNNIVAVNTVATSNIALNKVATYIESVKTVSANNANINVISGFIDNVNTNATNITAINTNTANIVAINTVASMTANVTTVANRSLDIAAVVYQVIPNMAEILLADNNAVIATTKASEASVSAAAALVNRNVTDADVVLTHADVVTSTYQANLAITASNSSQASAIITNAYANINWAGFRYVDGELLVDYFNTTTSTPSLVNGELILTW